MSVRMFPCWMNSAVVPPEIPASRRAGRISSSSTRSKLMPFLIPKGRTMKACMGATYSLNKIAKVLQLDLFRHLFADTTELARKLNRIQLLNLLRLNVMKPQCVQTLTAEVSVVASIEEMSTEVLTKWNDTTTGYQAGSYPRPRDLEERHTHIDRCDGNWYPDPPSLHT